MNPAHDNPAKDLIRYLLIGFLMVAASVAATLLRFQPLQTVAKVRPNLETMIPQSFGKWRIDPNVAPIQPAPEVKELVEKTYDQTIGRTYINEDGERVMLSVAYGSKRQEDMQAHRPESCYPAQGFEVMGERLGQLATEYGELPIKRLLALRGPRSEPITYWLVLGGERARFGLQHRFATLKFALTGRIPDGMLIRVSSISRDTESAYQVQDAFIKDLLTAVSPSERELLVGKSGV